MGNFEATGQRLVDQVRHIHVNGWLSDLEMEDCIQHGTEQPLISQQETHDQANEIQGELLTAQCENIASTGETEVNDVGDEWIIDEGTLSNDEAQTVIGFQL